MARLREVVKVNIKQAQATAAELYNKDRIDPPEYGVGDRVWVNAKNWQPKCRSKKLDDKLLGQFELLKICRYCFTDSTSHSRIGAEGS